MRPGDVVVTPFKPSEKSGGYYPEYAWGHVHHIFDDKVVVAFIHEDSWTFRTVPIDSVEQPHRVGADLRDSGYTRRYNLGKPWETPTDAHNFQRGDQRMLEAQVQKAFPQKSWWLTTWERWEPRLDILAELVQEALGRFVLRLRGGR